MLIFPAIDILNGRCVRLSQGDYERATLYAEDPLAVALWFAAAGARWLHLVDLDAARRPAGGSEAGPEQRDNRGLIAEIKRESGCLIEAGGGIRGEDDVEKLLEAGVDRLILGTLLAKDPDRVGEWVKRYGRVFAAGIDARDGSVKVAGWREGAGIGDLELARRAAGLGCRGIVYTNIARDGMLGGADVGRTRLVAEASGLPVILSGGVGGTADLEAAEAAGGLAGAIVGRAVYEGRLDPVELFRRWPQVEGEVGAW